MNSIAQKTHCSILLGVAKRARGFFHLEAKRFYGQLLLVRSMRLREMVYHHVTIMPTYGGSFLPNVLWSVHGGHLRYSADTVDLIVCVWDDGSSRR